jgi:hypothetical protein
MRGRVDIDRMSQGVLPVMANQHIFSEAAGSPVINERGELVAVVSRMFDQKLPCCVYSPCPVLALPVWMVRQLLGEQRFEQWER